MKKIGVLGLTFSLLSATAVNAADIYVKGINISGLQRVEQETVLSYIDIQNNKNVSQEKLDEALKQLYATGLFTDVSFNVAGDNVLNIKVVENPIVNKRAFDGNDKIGDEMLETEVQLGPRSIYSRAKVQEDVQRILEVYKRAGRYAAVVEPKIIQRDQNRVDLIYEIDEGPEAKISKVNFIGNKHYSDDDLQEEIMSKESRWYRIFSSKETYDAEKTNYDKELLRRFYLRHGYADFRVVSAVGELSPDKKSFVLNYILDEGRRYKVRKIDVVSKLSEIDVKPMFDEVTFESGDWYNADEVEKSVSEKTNKSNEEKTNGDLILEHIEAKSTEETDKNPSLSRTEKDSLSESSSKAINDKDAKDKKQSVKELLDGYKDEIKADRAKDIADKSKTVADTVIKSAKSIKER